MWYFTWILGLSVAVLFAVVNAMWLEVQDDNNWHEQRLLSDAGNNTGSDSSNTVT